MLQLTGVHVGYGRTSVVHGVDIEVADGGVTAIMGHNGAGKTTLLRAAVGLLPVRSGRVLLVRGGRLRSCGRTSASAAGSPTCRRASSRSAS